jgi:hypothetical protein
MKQTAVEFLVEKIKPLYIGNFEMTFLNEIEQAKEMEKQQQDEFTIKFAEWKDINCIYYDGWNIRVPLGDKYNDVYTNEQLLEIFKNKK